MSERGPVEAMNLLIIGPDAHEFRRLLEPKFPRVTFHAVVHEHEAGAFVDRADILMAIRVSDDLLSRAVRLKWIQSIISGTDFFEQLPAFQRRSDLLLTSARGIHGPQMSELAIMLMVALNRQLPRLIRNQDRRIWEARPTPLLWRKKVGILGVGVIGRSIAQKCKAFEMTVIGVGPTPREVESVDRFLGLAELDQVLAEVDYFVCVAPSNSGSRMIINDPAIRCMKPEAFFINLGRGDLVDEPALVQALKERRIAGAALDTFWAEPLPAEHPFWEMDNVIVTPHVGGMSDVYVSQACGVVEENLRRYLSGERQNLQNVVRAASPGSPAPAAGDTRD